MLFAALAADRNLALTTALTYGLAYTFELGLSLASYFGTPRLTRLRILLFFGALALLAPQAAFARGNFDPTTEFEQHEWIPIHLGPLNLSITKAVVYLMLGTFCTIALGLFTMRSRLALLPGSGRRSARRSTRSPRRRSPSRGCPTKAIGRWFPYVATLLLFIFVVNLLGFIPLPLTGETYHGFPTWGSTRPRRRSR